jgi:hypothetical protein
MIQPLRNAHRRAFLALGVVLPAILVVGLMERHHNLPVSADLSNSPQGIGTPSVPVVWQKHSIDTYFYLNPTHDREVSVLLNPKPSLDEPDLLLYWTDTHAPATAFSQAQLLGPFVPGRHYRIPAGERRGGVVLYSLAHHEVIDRANIEVLP